MKTDWELERDVLAELRWERSVTEKGIGVTVKDGVVTLHGTVESYAQRYAAAQAAERVKGVRVVVDEMEIHLLDGHIQKDETLARAVANALDWDTFIPKGKINVTVSKGWVTLEGTVDYEFQRKAAERAIRNLVGLVGMSDLLVVDPPVPAAKTIKADIEAAIRRHAELDSNSISVETDGRKVTLRGTVESWPERRDAERAAWSAPGVTQVEDLIAVMGY